MAILKVKPRHLHAGHEAEFDNRGFRCVRVFLVLADSESDWPLGIRDAEDPATHLTIPALGTPHPTVALMRVRRVVPIPLGKGRDAAGNPVYAFNVRVEYDTQTSFAGVRNFNGGQIDDADLTFIQNPLARPPAVRWGFENVQVAKEKATHVSDNDGVDWFDAEGGGNLNSTALLAIVNSAGCSFDPPLVDDKAILVGSLTRNEASYNPVLAAQYMNAVNRDVWLGFPARTVKLVEWHGDRKFECNTWYWEVTYVIKIDWDTWDDVVLDQGMAYTMGDEPNRTIHVARDADDYAHSQPVRLDLFGQIIQDPKSPSHFRRFRNRRKELPFDVLNLE